MSENVHVAFNKNICEIKKKNISSLQTQPLNAMKLSDTGVPLHNVTLLLACEIPPQTYYLSPLQVA